MGTLDDKILGEKRHYYCSSSSDEGESDVDDDTVESSKKNATNAANFKTANKKEWTGLSRNTGPKGVIEDWQKYVQSRCEQQDEADREKLELCKKLALVCQPDDELEDVNTADFLLEYRKQRMQELTSHYGSGVNSCYGKVVEIHSPNDFLQMVDDEKETTTVVIHVYDQTNSACKKINEYLVPIAAQYKNYKFCKVIATSAGLSLHFKISGVPAFLVYKNKQIIGNHVRITDELGDDFTEGEVENYLLDNGILNSSA